MEDVRQIVDQTLSENEASRTEMLSLISSHEALAFVGAGLSTNRLLKYPSWSDLIRRTLFDAAAGLRPFTFSPHCQDNFLLMAEEVWSHFTSLGRTNELKSILAREYGPRDGPNCSPTHEKLVRLPFKAFITTNYDDCIQSALNEMRFSINCRYMPGIASHIKMDGSARHTLSAFLRSLASPYAPERKRVIHLHGHNSDPDSIILSSSQYYKAYGFENYEGLRTKERPFSTIHRNLAWSLLSTRRLVFFGCSMDDPYVMEMLKLVTSDLWEYSQPIHFVVLPLDKNSIGSAKSHSDMFKLCGLKSVYFDNLDETFTKLDQLLDLALAQSGERADSIIGAKPAPNSIPSAMTPVGALSSGATTSTPIPPSWLDEINQNTVKDLRNEN